MDPNGNWLLRIYNDNINTREYVAVCLVQVTGLCESRAYYTMQQAHSNGIAKVGEYNQEVAECYEDQLNERGIVCDVIAKEQEGGGSSAPYYDWVELGSIRASLFNIGSMGGLSIDFMMTYLPRIDINVVLLLLMEKSRWSELETMLQEEKQTYCINR